MSTEHADISREHSAVLRTMMQVALQVSEQLTRRREQRLRDAAAASDRRARELDTRLRTEQTSAETALRAVHRDRWWSSAQPEQIGEQMRLAHTWKDRSPIAAEAASVIDEQLHTRYAITRSRENLDMIAVSAAVQRDISIQQRREAAAAQYASDGFTVLDEQPRGPGFVADKFLRTGAAFDQPVTDEIIRRDPGAWAAHLTYSPSSDTVVASYYCTNVDSLPYLSHEHPTVERQFDEIYLDSAPADRIADLHYTAADFAKENVRERIRERFGVDAGSIDAGARTAPLGALLSEVERARTNPDAARTEAASVDRASVITDIIDPAGELDRDQLAAAWQWHTATNPRTAEHQLYGAASNTRTHSDAFDHYLTHIAADWAREHRPGLLTDGDPGRRRERIAQAWIEGTGTDYPRLDPEATRALLGPVPPVTTTDLDTVVEWGAVHVPRDFERYEKHTGKEKTAAENELRLRFDVDHARAWANDHAPALAASYAQAEASPDRAAYLTARGELIDSWNHAQRPIGAELVGEPEQPRAVNVAASEHTTPTTTQPVYDSAERRDNDTATLRKAGVDTDAINAHRLADLSNAKPATAIELGTPAGAKASKGDRSGGKNISHDRGSR
ncbi:hypothetical protein [Rhodococcoides fascians]|uniref:hypothetical protein n=1 Tax=Rhodococcoides fascians TaxID=1828 RepID=UPI0006902ABC|nr:hypothetical protein [Rhodococcus fascians]